MRTSVFRRLLAAALLLLAALPASAQLFRAYLASDGLDTNPCTLALPCRLLPAALAAVANNGEIWMLDSANYNTGTVNINKSVTLLAVPGAVGSVVATTSSNAINIATAGVNVVLRNLVIVPVSGSTGLFEGIFMSDGASLVVEQCSISGMSNRGIYMTAAAKLRVLGSVIRATGGTGIWVTASTPGTTANVDILDTTLEAHTAQAIVIGSSDATAAIRGSLYHSRVVQGGNAGVNVSSSSGASVLFTIADSLIADNGLSGIIVSGAGAKIWASGNTITGNTYGLNISSPGIFESGGNNSLRNNTNNLIGSGAITVIGTN